MLQKLKAASFWGKVGYFSLVITVLLGLSNVSGKVFGYGLKIDQRYAKQVDLDKTNLELAGVQLKLKVSRLLQLNQQLLKRNGILHSPLSLITIIHYLIARFIRG